MLGGKWSRDLLYNIPILAFLGFLMIYILLVWNLCLKEGISELKAGTQVFRQGEGYNVRR